MSITPTQAQVSLWQLGGDERVWSENDSSQVFVDFETFPGAIAPVYFNGEENSFSKLNSWSPFKFSKQYVRFIRLQRKPSIDDKAFASGQANVQQGTIGEFERKGQGVPKRVFYWDGRDDSGQVMAPGLYLVEIALESEFRTFRHLQPLGVAY